MNYYSIILFPILLLKTHLRNIGDQEYSSLDWQVPVIELRIDVDVKWGFPSLAGLVVFPRLLLVPILDPATSTATPASASTVKFPLVVRLVSRVAGQATRASSSSSATCNCPTSQASSPPHVTATSRARGLLTKCHQAASQVLASSHTTSPRGTRRRS